MKSEVGRSYGSTIYLGDLSKGEFGWVVLLEVGMGRVREPPRVTGEEENLKVVGVTGGRRDKGGRPDPGDGGRCWSWVPGRRTRLRTVGTENETSCESHDNPRPCSVRTPTPRARQFLYLPLHRT